MSRATPILVLVGIAILTGCADQPELTGPRVASPPQPKLSFATNAVTVDPPVILNGLDGSSDAIPHGINALGDVAGESFSGNVHLVLWPRGKTDPTDLGAGSFAYDINAAGQIVGQSGNNAALWTPTGRGAYTITNIGAQLPSSIQSTAYGVNSKGQVVGTYRTSPKPDVVIDNCFLWTPPPALGPLSVRGRMGTVTTLTDLGGTFCVANDINSAGYIAGASNLSTGESRAFLWSPSTPNGTAGTMQNLAPNGEWSYAATINDAMEVAGQRLAADVATAAVWTPTGNGTFDVIDLGQFTGDLTFAMDINDAGFVTGYARRSDLVQEDAFIWRNGSFTLLAGLAPITTASALMNVSGTALSVIGISTHQGTTDRTGLRWDVSVPVVTPDGCLAQLIQAVKQLQADETLRLNEARPLMTWLEATAHQIDQRKLVPARYLVESVNSEVKALMSAGRLTSEQAEQLINLGLCVIEGL